MEDDMIILSDCSDELENSKKSKEASDESDISLSEFPIVDLKAINAITKKNKKNTIEDEGTIKKRSRNSNVNTTPKNSSSSEREKEKKKKRKSSDSDTPETSNKESYSKNKNTSKESQSDSDYETQNPSDDYWDNYLDELKTKYNVEKRNAKYKVDDLTSDEDEESPGKEEKINDKKERKKREPKTKKGDEEKKKRQEEREQEKIRKQEEAAKQKAFKQLNSKNRLNVNPEHCMKQMEIRFDEEIKNFDFYTEFLKTAPESEVKHSVNPHLVPNSITWKRKVEENYLNDKHEICSNIKIVNENQIMLIWDCEETVKHIHGGTFVSAISNTKSLVSDKKLSLVIYKIESYFKHMKTVKDRAVQNEISNGNEKQKKSKTKVDKMFSNCPKISRKKFEECLVEIELMHNVSSRLIENPGEMVLLIHQYTKALALLPSKMEKRQEESKMDWYANCDNRDTVKVDKDGNGLKRLWQQQLCQFNLMSLETSEAIASVYKCPLKLIEAYANCTPAEGEMLVKDIPIRRAAGPLTSVRKIGPELSKKLYMMFTSDDGEIYLND